jgi:hypothetical protein
MTMNESTLTRWADRAPGIEIALSNSATPHRTAMRLLRPVELATMRITAPDPETITTTLSTINEAAVRLAIWSQRGDLERCSPEKIARNLQSFFFIHSHQAFRPWRGYELLLQIDRTAINHGVRVWVDSPPTRTARHFQTLRLSERITRETIGI